MILIVSPLRQVERLIADRRPSHLVTLMDPEWMIDTHEAFAPDRHLKLNTHDIEAPRPGMTAPDAGLVERLIAFGEGWDQATPMLIHCLAGISRSTAAAYVVACALSPGADEAATARRLRAAAPHAWPNRRIVALADARLDRRGRMIAAIEAIGGNNFATEGRPFDFPVRDAAEHVR